MARTSKRQREINGAVEKKTEKIYLVGIYARLSVDVSQRKNESIETQVEIAKAFMKQQSNMRLVDCYTDIGKTGTSFARKGFERMMRDVRMRRIDCIIVKDLSRFGRNHIETGNYIEKIFPFLGVRFIAVTDHFDSMYVTGQNEMWSVNLKNLVNEMYARDIARKVKSSRQEEWEQGSYTGGVPPYGYRTEWVEDQRCLFPEKATSEIVRKIFELFLSGKNRKEIVRWLYENRITRPAEYHKTGKPYVREEEPLVQWSGETVNRILTNPVYLGCLVKARQCGKAHRIRSRHDLDSEEWLVKEHTHEAIISEEMFFEAAARLEKAAAYRKQQGYGKRVQAEEDIFAGVLFCGECGTKMKRNMSIKSFRSGERVRAYSYHCPKAARMDEYQCVMKSITFSVLGNLVKEALRKELVSSAMNPKELAERNNREAERRKEEWSRRLLAVEKRIENRRKLGSEQYFRYRMGEMDEERFQREMEVNHKRIASLQTKSAAIAEKLRNIDAETAQKNHFLYAMVRGNEKTELTTEAVRTWIRRIEIYPDHRVKVILTFTDGKCC